MPYPSSPKRRRTLGALLRADDGTVVLEFAIVAIPFFAVMLASLMTSLVYFGQQGLQTAAEAAARVVMTGEAQSAGMTQAQFQAKACSALPPFMPCNNLYVDVQSASTFGTAPTSAPTMTFDSSGKVNNGFSYSLGSKGSIVVVRLMYLWPLPAVALGYDLSTASNGQRVLIATTVAKTEPYS